VRVIRTHDLDVQTRRSVLEVVGGVLATGAVGTAAGHPDRDGGSPNESPDHDDGSAHETARSGRPDGVRLVAVRR
jgi:hypothetical protein